MNADDKRLVNKPSPKYNNIYSVLYSVSNSISDTNLMSDVALKYLGIKLDRIFNQRTNWNNIFNKLTRTSWGDQTNVLRIQPKLWYTVLRSNVPQYGGEVHIQKRYNSTKRIISDCVRILILIILYNKEWII